LQLHARVHGRTQGFATNKTWIAQRRISDANGFFSELVTRPYKGSVVLSPHLYGFSVTMSPDTGRVQWEKYEVSWVSAWASACLLLPRWPRACRARTRHTCHDARHAAPRPTQGTLQKSGYCSPSSPGACQAAFPVVPGEIGSSFANPLDLQYYADLATFMKREAPADAFTGVPMGSWFWWAYNANSGLVCLLVLCISSSVRHGCQSCTHPLPALLAAAAASARARLALHAAHRVCVCVLLHAGDTGGLVADDWVTLNWQKLRWLQQNVGLRGWYM
jgi:hypothetical protein